MSLVEVLLLITAIRYLPSVTPQEFPDGFMFGVATSAYQIEGGWNASGKGVNIWDHLSHMKPETIADKSTADISCDSYHKVKEDVALLKELGVQFYRFSLSWSRILPNGYANYINPDGIRYYNELIDELVKNDIKPMVTLFHWDLPLPLQDIGGWANPMLVDAFVEFAEVAFIHFGDRVPYWITFNTDCRGYEGDLIPPTLNQSGIGNYLCGYVTIKAHARTYRLYEEKFKESQKGEVGIVSMGVTWYEEKTDNPEDIEAAERVREFELGFYNNPIMGNGDYTDTLKERVAFRSLKEGFPKSRLPEFTDEEKHYIKGAYDFIATNIYTTNLVSDIPEPAFDSVHYMNDIKAVFSLNPSWEDTTAPWLKVTPDCIRKLLNWFKNRFNNPKIIISENGCADSETFADYDRIDYHKRYLREVLKAVNEDHVNVVGYAAWSLLDNFEWNDGYTQKFGLYHVDFTSPNRTRTPKLSAQMYQNIIRERRLSLD